MAYEAWYKGQPNYHDIYEHVYKAESSFDEVQKSSQNCSDTSSIRFIAEQWTTNPPS